MSKKYKNPTVDDYLKRLSVKGVAYGRSDAEWTMIRALANEVIKLRNEVPCPRCLGTSGRMCTGEVYMGGPETYDTCDQCKKHKGKKYPPMKKI